MDVDGDRELATVTDLLADEVVRTILETTVEEWLSADALADQCEVSPTTVYRRLEDLVEYDLVAVRTEPDDEGHHYKVYTARLDQAVLDLTTEGFEVRVTRRQRMADRFTEFVEGIND